MIFPLLFFSDYRVQCSPIPGFDSAGELSGTKVAAHNPWRIMSLWEKDGRTELHYPASLQFFVIFQWESEPPKTNIEDTVAPSRRDDSRSLYRISITVSQSLSCTAMLTSVKKVRPKEKWNVLNIYIKKRFGAKMCLLEFFYLFSSFFPFPPLYI